MKCLCASARRASRLLTRHYENALRPANVTSPQFELLSTLSARGSLSQTDLTAALGVDQTTLSRNLGILLARRWIEHRASASDRRRSTYVLTRAGGAAWRTAVPLWQRAQSEMQEHLGDKWSEVWAGLDALTAAG